MRVFRLRASIRRAATGAADRCLADPRRDRHADASGAGAEPDAVVGGVVADAAADAHFVAAAEKVDDREVAVDARVLGDVDPTVDDHSGNLLHAFERDVQRHLFEVFLFEHLLVEFVAQLPAAAVEAGAFEHAADGKLVDRVVHREVAGGDDLARRGAAAAAQPRCSRRAAP